MTELRMTYTGLDIVDHDQGAGRVHVMGSTSEVSPVDIVVQEYRDGNIMATFQNVAIGNEVAIPYSSGTITRTRISIVSTDESMPPKSGHSAGNDLPTLPGALQVILLHTSCSVPVRLDDQFGSMRVSGFSTNGSGFPMEHPLNKLKRANQRSRRARRWLSVPNAMPTSSPSDMTRTRCTSARN